MRSALLFIPFAFAADIGLKVLARMDPDALGRFSFSTPVGTIGLAPSVNAILAFSLPVPNVVIWPVGWTIVAWLVAMFLRNTKNKEQKTKWIALHMIIFGAVSNLTDRTFLGGVTDYLSLTSLFPAFNIADLLIIVGIVGWVRSERGWPNARSAHSM